MQTNMMTCYVSFKYVQQCVQYYCCRVKGPLFWPPNKLWRGCSCSRLSRSPSPQWFQIPSCSGPLLRIGALQMCRANVQKGPCGAALDLQAAAGWIKPACYCTSYHLIAPFELKLHVAELNVLVQNIQNTPSNLYHFARQLPATFLHSYLGVKGTFRRKSIQMHSRLKSQWGLENLGRERVWVTARPWKSMKTHLPPPWIPMVVNACEYQHVCRLFSRGQTTSSDFQRLNIHSKPTRITRKPKARNPAKCSTSLLVLARQLQVRCDWKARKNQKPTIHDKTWAHRGRGSMRVLQLIRISIGLGQNTRSESNQK